MRHIERGGTYVRVVDPGWADPLDASFSRRSGGRWNPPGTFAALYLCRDVETARANARRQLEGQPFTFDDLLPERLPALVETTVPQARYVDAVSARGLASLALPASHPLDGRARIVSHERCRPIGAAAWDAGEPGIACRSAAPGAPAGSEELALFARGQRLRRGRRPRFERWYRGRERWSARHLG
jgi:RES domain-containing protein